MAKNKFGGDVFSKEPVALTASTSITRASYDGFPILMGKSGAAYTFTLPAATGTGAKYEFVVSVVNTSNYIIKVAASPGTDIIQGNIWTNSTGDNPDLGQPWPTAADSDTITLNGTTTGGVGVGDTITLTDIATGKWRVLGFTTTSGTEATPFSAAVSAP